ncbi:MAG: M14 family zinc carboxypeptidase [Anaerolineae bacterium]|jgi:hypothetical protein
MHVTADFECGNGKNIREVVPGHFRLDEVGEKPPYCKYFCVRVEADGDGGLVQLDVYPDPDLGEVGRIGMMGHYPSQIWYSTDEMERWRPTENSWENTTEFHETHLVARVRMKPGTRVYVASNPVACYTRVANWARSLGARGAGDCHSLSLGASFEERQIPLLRIPARGPDPTRVFVFAGQHPSEHCAVFMAMGAAEFLLSGHPEAEALRERFEVWVCPMINVDGNVHGRNGWTLQDVNMFEDFKGAAEGALPQAVEDQLLWRYLTEEVLPAITFQFHGFMGKRGFIDPPYDGLYTFTDPHSVYEQAAAASRYETIQAAMAWDTDGLTGHGRPNVLAEDSLEYQLARLLGTIPVFYEINHGYHGVWASKRKGAHVLRTALRAWE